MQSNEFFCNYRRDTLYRESNRIVYFWRGRSGQTVYASYKAAGSPVTADDMNEIKAFMESTTRDISAQATAQTNLQNQIVVARNEARTALTAHNISTDAHSDIRDALAHEKIMPPREGFYNPVNEYLSAFNRREFNLHKNFLKDRKLHVK